ncbi:hypothetical protein HMPREF1860_01331 [Prevotella amnii]|uniref:Uncharacterized protein n=2 Tax=Prevotella amnii TaxID=419005 RepID=A0A134BC60_9BACT|nr:hypothetical protein HMPREF1860_01331 [Prevotella amnii]
MGMTVRKMRDTQTPRVIMHKVADVRGGVSVKTSELAGDYLSEGTPISKPQNGICHVIKIAVVKEKASESATEVKVSKGTLFNVGDAVFVKEGAKAAKITKIDRKAKDADVLTISEAIGALEKGATIVEAKKEGDEATLKYEPFALVGTGQPISPKSNVNTDAWIIAVTKGNNLPLCVEEKLKGIINY